MRTDDDADWVQALELPARWALWIALGVASAGFYARDVHLWRGAIFAVALFAAFATDFAGRWVPGKAFWETNAHLWWASACRLGTWALVWFAIWWTPRSGYDWLWVSAGALWLLNAALVALYTFDDSYEELFGPDARRVQLARRLFRVVTHDVVTGGFVVALGWSVGDVFDGDADDSKWRSLLSGATIFQLFMTLWQHWDDLHRRQTEGCCSGAMRNVWRQLVRFAAYCGIFVAVLFRTHEDEVLVNLGQALSMVVVVGVACALLAVTSRSTD